jgi:predicted nuclease with TOPRIM domain
MLANEVKMMKKQGQDSEAKLKSLFMEDFQAGVKRHNALLSQNKVLKETLEKMQSYHTRLETADKHLQGTQSTLETRLHDGGLFMQKLSELTMAKPEAAVKALETLQKQK